GTPLDIYQRPQNTFVAGFLGSPPMNLIPCEATGGSIRNPAFTIDIPVPASGRVTLGQRPEDLRIEAPEKADIRAEVFTAELLGDAALVTVKVGGDFVVVKADKDCPARMGDTVGIGFRREALHVFGADGERLPGIPALGRAA
ncbi:TOBE domain-containing protein, partial [Nostoc sp. NIES-2111]